MTYVSKKSFYIMDALKAGLSTKAAAVYVSLLEAGGPLAPKALVARTLLHRQYVYDGLHELTRRKLVLETGKGRLAKYMATSPEGLMQEAEKRRLDAIEGVRNLRDLYERSPAGVVEIIRGSRELIETDLDLIRNIAEGERIDIVGGAGLSWVELFGKRAEDWEQFRKEKNVSVRYIGTEKDVAYNREVAPVQSESRVIEGIGNIVNTVIWPDNVTFDIYEPEILAIRVRSQAAVESQRALFEVLWAAAK